MWIFSTKGFFSVVEHKKNHKIVMIRSRVKKDIQNMKEFFDGLGLKAGQIVILPKSDYRYRFTAKKKDWVRVMTKLMNDMDYTNFKDAVYSADCEEIKDKRHKAYLNIWSEMHSLQRAC